MSTTRAWNSDRIRTLVLLLIFLTVGGLAYGFSLRLPFFLDDMAHFRWLQGQSWSDILTSARKIGYYRPLPFLLWKTLWSLQGRLHGPTLHAINLGLHLINGLLVWQLVTHRDPSRGMLLGAASALLFLLYPFSYQAVPWVGSLTHPLVAACILGALYLHQIGEESPSRLWRAGSFALAWLAPLAHETGVLVALLLSLLLLTRDESTDLNDLFRRTWVYWLGALVGLTLWLIVPKGVKTPQLWNLEARYQNGVYLLQGLAYPIAPLARRLFMVGWGLDDLQSILAVSVPAVFLWALLTWRAGGGRLLLLAGGWFTLTIAPAWLMLGFEYVVDGPRLMYTASVGAALFWSIPLAYPAHRRVLRLRRAVAMLVVLIVAVQGALFIRERAAIYEQLRLLTEQFVLGVRSISAPGTVLCVNCPEFLAPRAPTFAVGHEGVPFFVSHQLDDFFWVNTGEERAIKGAVLPDVQTPWRYHYGGAGQVHTRESLQAPLRQAGGVLLTDYSGEDLALYPVGALEAQGASPQRPFLTDFDGRVRLLSASVAQEAQGVRVELRWQALQPLEKDVTIFLHQVDASDQLVRQRDGYPLMGLSYPLAWQPGDIWRDVRWLPKAAALEGDTTLMAGLYPLDGSPRLEAVGPAQQRFPNNAVPVATVTFP